MLSLYAQFIHEKTTDKILETDDGYAMYRFLNDGRTVYVVEIYVVPEKRRSGVASQIMNDIAYLAKAQGCTEMLGSVIPSSKYSTRSLKACLGYGFTLASAGNDFIILRKDI